jgi:hypothetical protein
MISPANSKTIRTSRLRVAIPSRRGAQESSETIVLRLYSDFLVGPAEYGLQFQQLFSNEQLHGAGPSFIEHPLYTLQELFFESGRLRSVSSSDKNDRLGTWDFESPSTTDVSTGQHVIDSYHVIAGFLKAGSIHFVGAPWCLCFLCAFQPANIIFRTLSAVRTAETGFLNFFFLIKKITLVHTFSFPLTSLTKFSKIAKTVDSSLMPVAPTKIDCVATYKT